MPVTLRWVGESDLDRVAETRVRCYATAAKELEQCRQVLRADPRPKPGDYLLAEDGDEAVGTATTISFTTWVRGSPLPCQGVAWVGTIRTRRRGGDGNSRGVASRLMHETIRAARERGQALSALMPFRASFYEHFGYGVVERRCEWTVPLAILPSGPFEGLRFARPGDRGAIAACHQRAVERGQCDMERSAARWEHLAGAFGDGFEVVDRPATDGPVRGQLFYSQFSKDGRDLVRVQGRIADDLAAFQRQLHFLASLKDQYHAVTLSLPSDVPLNWLLKERQIPHRLVSHPTAEIRPITRMQVRVLDHAKLLEGMRLPAHIRGEAVVAVHETEGHVSKFRIAISDGRAEVRPTEATADVECRDSTWAAVVLGDLPARQAISLGLVGTPQPKAAGVLEAFSVGPAPFCEEYF